MSVANQPVYTDCNYLEAEDVFSGNSDGNAKAFTNVSILRLKPIWTSVYGRGIKRWKNNLFPNHTSEPKHLSNLISV